MIIVEGPDGAGKTTLARAIAQHYNLRIEQKDKEDRSESHGPPQRSARERTWEALGIAVSGNHPVVIHDRLFVSELIYGPIVRAATKFSSQEAIWAERVFAALGAPFIHCRPPKDVVLENIKGEAESQYAANRAAEIYDAYGSYWPGLLNTYVFDYTDPHPGGLYRFIDLYMERRRVRSW